MNHEVFISLILKCCCLNKKSDDNFAVHYHLANYAGVQLQRMIHYAFQEVNADSKC